MATVFMSQATPLAIVVEEDSSSSAYGRRLNCVLRKSSEERRYLEQKYSNEIHPHNVNDITNSLPQGRFRRLRTCGEMVDESEGILAKMRGSVEGGVGLTALGGAKETQDGVEGGADGAEDTRRLDGGSKNPGFQAKQCA